VSTIIEALAALTPAQRSAELSAALAERDALAAQSPGLFAEQLRIKQRIDAHLKELAALRWRIEVLAALAERDTVK